MNADALETTGGKPAVSARSGGASYSGPSSRTRAESAAGAGARVSGGLRAVLLAAAALLLAPGGARADAECGAAGSVPITLTCPNAAYSDGIQYDLNSLASHTGFNVPGRSSGPTTITAGSPQAVGIYLKSRGDVVIRIGGETMGTPHVVNIVQGTNNNNNVDRNVGIYV